MVVIGPIDQTPSERLASWFLMTELRRDIKWMRGKDPVRYESAIDKEEQTVREEFNRYVQYH